MKDMINPSMEEVLNNIEIIRKEKRIKQEVIAAELGIKQSSYSSYIRRESDITYSRLLHISNILGVSVIDIITYPEKYVPETPVKHCSDCTEKDRTIQHLNKYIELLEKKFSIGVDLQKTSIITYLYEHRKKRKKRKFPILLCFPMLKTKELSAVVINSQENSHFMCTSICGNGMFNPS